MTADFVVLAAEPALEDRERVLEQLRGLVVAAGGVEDRRQRGAIGGGGGVVVAERGGADGDGRARRGLSVGGPPAGVRESADVVQHHGDVRVRRAEPGDEDGVGLVDRARRPRRSRPCT